MGVLKDHPFVLRVFDAVLVFVGCFVGTEIDSIAHILWLGEDISDDIAAPVIRVRIFFLAFPDPHAFFTKVDSRCFHFIVKEDSGNVIGTFSVNRQPEYPSYNSGRFLVNQPVIFVLRVFFVPVDHTVGCGLAGFAFDADRRFLLPAQVPQIPFVHDIEERGKFACCLVVAVHAVCNGNKMNASLTEHDIRIKAGLKIIPADTAHVLYNDVSHFPSFNILHQLFPSRAFKITAAPAVVRIMDAVRVASLCGIAFEIFFLIYNRIAIPGVVIVAGQSFI